MRLRVRFTVGRARWVCTASRWQHPAAHTCPATAPAGSESAVGALRVGPRLTNPGNCRCKSTNRPEPTNTMPRLALNGPHTYRRPYVKFAHRQTLLATAPLVLNDGIDTTLCALVGPSFPRGCGRTAVRGIPCCEVFRQTCRATAARAQEPSLRQSFTRCCTTAHEFRRPLCPVDVGMRGLVHHGRGN